MFKISIQIKRRRRYTYNNSPEGPQLGRSRTGTFLKRKLRRPSIPRQAAAPIIKKTLTIKLNNHKPKRKRRNPSKIELFTTHGQQSRRKFLRLTLSDSYLQAKSLLSCSERCQLKATRTMSRLSSIKRLKISKHLQRMLKVPENRTSTKNRLERFQHRLMQPRQRRRISRVQLWLEAERAQRVRRITRNNIKLVRY